MVRVRSNRGYQCFVCYRVYPPEQLGRCLLPIYSRRHQLRTHRVVCLTCYQSVVDSWPVNAVARPPTLHGF